MICGGCGKHIPATVNYCAYCAWPTDNAALRSFAAPQYNAIPVYLLLLPVMVLAVSCCVGSALYTYVSLALKGVP